MTKQTMWASLDIPTLATAIDLENRTQVLAATTGDHREALLAFNDGRPPRYSFT
jgi:enoyl-CoA hydratase